jgi:hypothetical protein
MSASLRVSISYQEASSNYITTPVNCPESHRFLPVYQAPGIDSR